MCCFSGNVTFVASTRIFARMTEAGRQGLVYQMQFGAKEDLAIILPLPVAKEADEKALHFIDLSAYPDFFKHLRAGFPADPKPRAFAAAAGDTLEVKRVGSYDASFVPAVKDFERLDPRFRLPAETWKAIPLYADYGFAVFKLRSGTHEVHPMALTFPTRQPEQLFFPTVHIHDGKVHPEEHFDHALYCQVQRLGAGPLQGWQESADPASRFTKPGSAAKLIDPDEHVYRRRMVGEMKNEDIILATA